MNDTDQTYTVATYSYTCTAYVRTMLRRALELHPTHNVWVSTEYVNAAQGMTNLVTWSDILPDETTWSLTKTQLTTIYIALQWCRDECLIEGEIYRALQGIWHSEGKYWM